LVTYSFVWTLSDETWKSDIGQVQQILKTRKRIGICYHAAAIDIINLNDLPEIASGWNFVQNCDVEL
jgi:hypothetical protein